MSLLDNKDRNIVKEAMNGKNTSPFSLYFFVKGEKNNNFSPMIVC